MSNRYYLDSSFILVVVKGRAHNIPLVAELLNSRPTLIASKLVELECLATAKAVNASSQSSGVEAFFARIDEWVEINDSLLDQAITIAESTPGLKAADAIHLAASQTANAVFLCAEKPNNPPLRAKGVESLSVYRS
ncbi:MAG: PIN domain-containing protein [Planctomycetes bacterium]|nr:PIN domain-containing protein [Planctomycetota bacterium]